MMFMNTACYVVDLILQISCHLYSKTIAVGLQGLLSDT